MTGIYYRSCLILFALSRAYHVDDYYRVVVGDLRLLVLRKQRYGQERVRSATQQRASLYSFIRRIGIHATLRYPSI